MGEGSNCNDIQKVLGVFLKENRALTIVEICEMTGLEAYIAKKKVYRLKYQGFLVTSDFKTYCMPPEDKLVRTMDRCGKNKAKIRVNVIFK